VNLFSKTFRLGGAAIRRFLSDPTDALLMCRMASWLAFLSAATKFCSLPRALDLVSARESRLHETYDPETPIRLAQSIDLLLATDVLFLKPICWKRAAVLRRYLSKQGIATRIIFGVRKELTTDLDGHAWLELNGQPFLEKTPPEYVVTYTFPSNERREPELALLPNKNSEAI
jgi:hypothetical protein